jgi:hypothetical protein
MTKPYIYTGTSHQSQKPRIKRTHFISRTFKTDTGAPFLFKGREYLKEIYNRSYRYLVLLASRQAEKSTYLSKDMLCDAILKPNDSLLYVTALQHHSDEFVRRKVNRQFELNPVLKDQYLGRGAIDNIRDKILSNGTSLTFRAVGQTADSARGIPARKIFFDELQSIGDENNIAIVSECAQSFPDDSGYLFAGTPLSTKNVLSKRYFETKQFEWLIRCSHCHKRNPPLGMEHIDVKKPFLFCIFCGLEMQAGNGEWVAKKPGKKLYGFRLSRLFTPACTWVTDGNDGVLDKYRTYSEAAFHQEVLGLPYDSGTLPITEAEILACCDENTAFINPENPSPALMSRPMFMALDWAWNTKEGGQSFTAMVIGSLNGAKIEILFVKRFQGPKYAKAEAVLSEIANIANRLNIKFIGSDYGIGHKENTRLSDMVKAKVFEFQYVNTNQEYYWDAVGKCYKVGRTSTLNLVYTRFKKGLYKLPRKQDIAPYASDLLNVITEYDPNYKRVRYVHTGGGPDDLLHLCNYLSIIIQRYYSISIR